MYTPKMSYTDRRNMPGKINQDIIEAAIVGYQSKIAGLQERIGELRSMLDGTPEAGREKTASAVEGTRKTGGGKRRMSAAAKRKLSAAAKKRWALLKRQHPNAKTLAG
jgi:hypothetical protein